MEGGDFSMSSIDERVVEMKFDNKQFAKGTADSISALDKLKSALNLDGVTKGLSNLDAAGKNFNLNNLSSSVDTLASHFEGLRAVALGALIAIGAKVVTLGQQIVTNLTNNLTSGARDGFKEYEVQINAIATILGNVKSKGEDLASVNAALDVLNQYSDKTIYNFTEMVSGIKTLTNSGVGLQKGVEVVKGFANAAALAGVSSEKMAAGMEFGLNQAITKGYLGVQDFVSIQDVVGEQFRNSLMETARLHGTNVDDIIAKNGSFRDSLSEGWVTSQVLMDTLSKFTGELSDEQLRSMGYTDAQIVGIQEMARTAVDAATKVRTWTQLIGTVAEVVGSGWATTWRTVIGDTEEAAKVFTILSDSIGAFISESNNARNAQAQIWSDMGGRDAIVQTIVNVFAALNGVLNPIKQAWGEVFPPTLGATLAKISKAIQVFTAGLVLSADGQQRVHDVAKILFTALKFGFDVISTLVEVGAFLVGVVFKLAGAFLGLLGPVIDFVTALAIGDNAAAKSTGKFFDLTSVLAWLTTYAINPLIAGINWLSDAFGKLMKGDPAAWAAKARSAFSGLIGMGENAANVWSKVVGFFKKVWEFIAPMVSGMKDGLKGLGKSIESAFSDIDWNMVIAGINTGFLAMIILSIKKYFDTASGFISSFTGMFDGVSGALKGLQQDLQAGALIKIAIAIGLLALALVALSQVNPNNLGPAIGAIAAMTVSLVGAMKLMDQFITDEGTDRIAKLSGVLILLSVALYIMSVAVAKLAVLDMDKMAASTGALVVMLYALVGAAMLLSNIKDDLPLISLVIISLAAALLTMATAVMILGNMPMAQMVQGLWALGLILAGLVGAIMLLSINNTATMAAAAALVAIAVAISVLVGAVMILGLVPINVLIQGISTMAIMLALLVGAILLMSINNAATFAAAAALLAMAIAMNILVTAVVALGMLPIDVLVQGLLAITVLLIVLAGTMYLMTGTLLGAAATLVVAAALIILSAAVFILGSMPFDMVIQGLVSLVAAILTMAVITLILTPIIPLMFLVGIALAAAGVGIVLMAGAMVVFSIGLALFGPAAVLAAGGLKILGDAIQSVSDLVPEFLLVSAGLLLFGVAAAVAGAGILVLAAGLLLLGVALTLIGAVGIIGATATIAVVNALMKLIGKAIGMGVLGAAFLVLGAGLTVLGVGAVVAGAGLILVGTGMLMLAGAASLGSLALTIMGKAVERLSAHVGEMNDIAGAIKRLSSSAGSASDGVNSTASGLNKLAGSASAAGNKSMEFANVVQILSVVLMQMVSVVMLVPQAMALMASASTTSMNTFKMGVVNAVPQVTQAAGQMVGSMINTIVGGLSAGRGAMGSSGYGIGNAIVVGMRNGLNDGSYLVTNAARAVAQQALASSKRALGVASPSKEYYKIGVWNDEGMANGQLDHVNVVEDASTTVAKAALNALSKAMSGAGGIMSDNMEFNPTITPVLDLSNIQENAGLISGLLTPPTLDVASSYARATVLSEEQQISAPASTEDTPSGTTVNYNQYNNSPKAISTADIYRNTKNQLSTVKKGLTTSAN